MNVCSTQAVGVYGGVHVSNVVARIPKLARISCQYLTCTLTHYSYHAMYTCMYMYMCTWLVYYSHAWVRSFEYSYTDMARPALLVHELREGSEWHDSMQVMLSCMWYIQYC